MLAHTLKFITFLILIFAGGVIWAFWDQAPVLAVTAVLVSLFLYIPFLGAQFLALRRVNREDPALPATVGQLMSAWWDEVVLLPRIFFWRQAFWWNHIPDATDNAFRFRGRRGVVFIHGFICNRGLWTPWLARLKKHRRAFVAVNLEPVFGSIDDYVPLIEQAIQKVTVTTGKPPVVVCHSMGGLVIRAWLRSAADTDERVHHIVTIGSPHHGTWLARFSFMRNGRQMTLANRWLAQLEADEPPGRHTLFTCFYSNCDNIVFPASSATLAGADNRFIAGEAHLALAFNQEVISESLAKI